MCELSIDDMDEEINRFIDAYDGTAIGESIYQKRQNAREDNYEDIEEIYDEVMEY